MDKHQLTAQIRDLKQKPAALRRQGLLPANVFGVGESRALTLSLKEVSKLLTQVSESTVFYLQLDQEEIPVMLVEVQKHPITGQLIHLSLRQVNLKQKVTTAIPLQTTGSFNVPGAFYHLVYDEIEAEALPTDLPEALVVDISSLKAIGDEIKFADLDYDRSKVSLKVDEKLPVVVVNEIVEEEEAPQAGSESENTAAPSTEATATASEDKKAA